MFSGKWTNQPPYEIKQAGINFNPANNTLPNQNFIKLQDQYPAGTGIALNPLGYNPLDPASAIFDRTETVEIQLYDNNYIDPNLKPPDNPLVQRIIPGSFELAGLVEKPYKNENLDYNHPDYNKPDYEVDYVNGKLILLSDKAKQLFFDDTTGELQATLNPPPISFEYIYHNSIDMTGEIYREVESGITMKVNSNPDDLFGKDGIGNTDSFKEIISLMQGLWYNEQSEIANGIDTVNAARERNLAQQAVEGSRLNRLEMVFDRNDYSTINNTDARSRIEDVEWEHIFTKFSRADAVYNASLAAASRIMQNTLLNYI
jgi:flagellin-like hook-associated protein FlgL